MLLDFSPNGCNLWVQCETPELRFLKCSIKWDVLTFCFSPVSASLLHSFNSLENTTLFIAYFPPSLTSFLYFSLKFSPVSLSCCVPLGNNDRALCISRCKRNRTTFVMAVMAVMAVQLVLLPSCRSVLQVPDQLSKEPSSTKMCESAKTCRWLKH